MTAEIVPLRRRGGPRVAGWQRAMAANIGGTIPEHLPRFVEHLKARNRAPRTIERYCDAAVLLSTYLGHVDVSTIGRAEIERFVAHRLETCSGSTVAGNFASLQQLFKFLVDELAEEGFRDPTEGMSKPRFEERPVQVPPAQIVEAMLRQTQTQRDSLGNRPFVAVRDEVILRILIDTGARVSEVADLTLADNLGEYIRVWGKSKGGGKVERLLAIGPKTQAALRRYLRARSHHPLIKATPSSSIKHADPNNPWLFLGTYGAGQNGKMQVSGVRQMVWKRSLACGQRIHPHQFRHKLAHDWQVEGGNEGNLMEIMGWRSPAMLRRYGKSAASERALTAHREWLEGRA